MKRILFVSSYTGLGGGETVLLSLMQAVSSRGCVPVLLVPREGRLPSAAREHGIDVHVIPYRGTTTLFVPALWSRLPAVRRFRSAVERIAPDFVSSDYHSLPFVAAALQRATTRRPLLYFCWGWWFRPRPWQRAFFRNAPAVIVAASRAIRDGFVGTPPFMPADRIVVSNPGVDPERFRLPRPSETDETRRALGIPVGVPLVTMLARFQDVKGHDVFLNAASLVAARVRDVRFAISGESAFDVSSEHAFKDRILRMHAADPVLRERVHLLGWQANPERLLAASDLLVCPSRFETYGMAIVEAMSCGLPVVSTNVGGPAEIVVDGTTGVLVPPRDPAALADAVIRVLGDAGLRQRMSTAARARVLERFTLDRFADEFVTLVDRFTARSTMSGHA